MQVPAPSLEPRSVAPAAPAAGDASGSSDVASDGQSGEFANVLAASAETATDQSPTAQTSQGSSEQAPKEGAPPGAEAVAGDAASAESHPTLPGSATVGSGTVPNAADAAILTAESAGVVDEPTVDGAAGGAGITAALGESAGDGGELRVAAAGEDVPAAGVLLSGVSADAGTQSDKVDSPAPAATASVPESVSESQATSVASHLKNALQTAAGKIAVAGLPAAAPGEQPGGTPAEQEGGTPAKQEGGAPAEQEGSAPAPISKASVPTAANGAAGQSNAANPPTTSPANPQSAESAVEAKLPRQPGSPDPGRAVPTSNDAPSGDGRQGASERAARPGMSSPAPAVQEGAPLAVTAGGAADRVSAHGNRSVESFSAWAAQSFSDADAAKGGDAAEAFAAKATLGDTGDRLAGVAARSGGQVSPGGQVSAGGQASPIVQTASSGGEQMQAAEPSMQTANARSTGAQGASATGAEGGRPVTPGSTGFRVEQALNAEFERGVVGRLRDNGEMRLAIEREGLGELDVRVAVRESSVHASIATQHDEARQLLASQRADLETALQRHNLRLDSFDVDVGGREGRGTARQDGDQAQHGGGAAGGATGLQDRAGGTAANDAAERLQPREWGGGLSVRV